MLKIVYLKLTADVRHIPQRQRKVKHLSEVSIKLDGGRTIARKTLGGKYSQIQALAEFCRHPSSFCGVHPFGTDDAAEFAQGGYMVGQVYTLIPTDEQREAA